MIRLSTAIKTTKEATGTLHSYTLLYIIKIPAEVIKSVNHDYLHRFAPKAKLYARLRSKSSSNVGSCEEGISPFRWRYISAAFS